MCVCACDGLCIVSYLPYVDKRDWMPATVSGSNVVAGIQSRLSILLVEVRLSMCVIMQKGTIFVCVYDNILVGVHVMVFIILFLVHYICAITILLKIQCIHVQCMKGTYKYELRQPRCYCHIL